MKTAIIDIDDTIGCLVPELVGILNKLTGKQFTVDDWTAYDTWAVYGVSREDYFNLCESDQILSKISPIPRAKETINFLSENGYRILYLTARGWHKNAYQLTLDWLEYHQFKVDGLHVLPLHQSKASYIKDNFTTPVDLIIDDNESHVRGFLEHNIAKQTFLIDGPWNRHATDLDKYRISSIDKIYNY